MRTELQQEIDTVDADVRRADEENAQAANWLDGQFEVIQKRERLAGLKRQLQELQDIDAGVERLRQKVKGDRKRSKMSRKWTTPRADAAEDSPQPKDDEAMDDADLIIDDEPDMDDEDDGDDGPAKTAIDERIQRGTQV